MEKFVVVYVTCPSEEEAGNLAKEILTERLAACANILNGVKSIFHWQNKIDSAQECLIILKTRKKLLKKLIGFVQLHHSYDVPEIIALPIVGGSEEYLKWIESEAFDI